MGTAGAGSEHFTDLERELQERTAAQEPLAEEAAVAHPPSSRKGDGLSLPPPASASQCLPVPEPSRKPESKEGQGGKIRKANGDHPGPCSNLEQRKATEFLGPCLVLGHFTSY